MNAKESHRVAIPDIDHAERRGGTEPKVVVAVVRGGRSSPLLERPQRIAISERSRIGGKAIRNYLPMQPGDVPATFAETSLLRVQRRGSLCRVVSRLLPGVTIWASGLDASAPSRIRNETQSQQAAT